MMRIALLFCAIMQPLSAFAQEGFATSERHVIMLYPGLDTIWGTYLAVVENAGQQPVKARVPILMPRETVDFQAQEGIDQSNLQLGDDGQVIAEFDLAPGRQMVGVGFKVDARSGGATLTLRPKVDLATLSVLIGRDGLSVQGASLTGPEEIAFGEQVQDMWTAKDIAAGSEYTLLVDGIPQGRGGFWMIGAVMASLLVVFAALLTWRSKPVLANEPLAEVAAA